MKKWASKIALLFIRAYQVLLKPFLAPRCRYIPTCSQYAEQAIIQHGVIKGGYLTGKRLCRCHPFGGHGFDPVPK